MIADIDIYRPAAALGAPVDTKNSIRGRKPGAFPLRSGAVLALAFQLNEEARDLRGDE